jgi:uncharacterized protein (TIGR02246 family)
MRRTWIVAGLVAVAALGWGVAREQNPPSGAAASDDAAVRASVDAFVAAFNKHDANAIGALFLADAKAVTENDGLIDGRDAITRNFATLFADNPQAKIEVAIDAIRFVGGDLAFEVGTARMTPAPGEAPELSRYTVVYAKRDGKWSIALVRDTDVDALTAHDRLKPLAWLVGEWIDESPEAVVMTRCRWSDDGNYLLQDIDVRRAGKSAMNVTQRIGYDAARKCIRSWAFDSVGGFVEGSWTPTESGWVIKATGVSDEGEAASATNTVERIGRDSYVWRSVDRVIGGRIAEPLEVRVVRRPPAAVPKAP